MAPALLAASGCGDDDDGAGSAGTQPTVPPASSAGDAALCRTRVDLEQALVSEQPDIAAVTTLPEEMEASAPAELAASAAGLATVLAGPAEAGADPTRDPACVSSPVGGGEDGPPHFSHGMVGEFEVK